MSLRHAGFSSLLLPLLFLVYSPVPASSQAPGYNGPDARQIRAEYRATVIGEINEALDDWSTAWSEDDLETLGEMYTDEAVVFPPVGPPIRGPQAVDEWLRGVLPTHGTAEAFLQDFEAAGNMAAVQTNYRIYVSDGPTSEVSGTLFTVFLQQGRSWRIRSQVFRETPPAQGSFP
jgi:ketosteroid isomerase-like protein